MKSTQEQFLETARKLFADRGFYGVSIANVADQHGLTKQAVLHHFPTKEKLYGEVLKEIATELHAAVQSAEANTDDPRERLIQLLVSMLPTTEDEVVRTRILTRELLDNKIRAQTASAWYLRPFLKELVKLTKSIPGLEHNTDETNLALVYQLLGAVSFYVVSGPTLEGIFGKAAERRLRVEFPKQFEAMLDAVIPGSRN